MGDKDLRILERNAKLNPADQESSSKFIYSKFRTELGTIENIISKLIEKIKVDSEFPIAWEIATHNCQGPIRLVGGKIYRGLIELIHNIDCGFKTCDWDFLTTKLTKSPVVPTHYQVVVSHTYGRTTYSRFDTAAEHRKRKFTPVTVNELQKPLQSNIDVFQPNSLETEETTWFSRLFAKQKEPELNDYIVKVPFTFQVGMLDLRTGDLSPSPILETLVTKKFEINNLNSLELAAKRYGYSNQAYIDLKTKTLENVGFRWQPQ